MEAIILVGGLGTRLRSVLLDLPKPMVPIGDQPFLYHLLKKLSEAGITRFILSIGYKGNVIRDFFGDSFQGSPIRYVSEENPLGTGGAIRAALKCAMEEVVIVLNGDSVCEIDLPEMYEHFISSRADICIAAIKRADTGRYGRLELDRSRTRVTAFAEKKGSAPGFINAGIYILRKTFFDRWNLVPPFSIEQDCLSKHSSELTITPYLTEGFFVDIGIPSDLAIAQSVLAGP